MKEDKNSRHIPKDISDKTKYRDYFRCVWCGTYLYERHHIVEWHLGGSHTVENLALLCPNCHTLIHRGFIDPLDLLDRVSTQKKGDRLGGLINPNVEGEPIFEVGTVRFENFKNIISFQGRNLLSYRLSEAGELLISYRFYDKNGVLIFWMHDNTYWSTANFSCSFGLGYFKLTSKIDNQYLQIEKQANESIRIRGLSYLNGQMINLDENGISFGFRIHNITLRGNGLGGAIAL